MKPRLLIAEPEAGVLDLLKRVASNCRYDVDSARDALEFLQRFQQRQPDLLLLSDDLTWGGSDGLLAQMRQGQLPYVPVVLMAAWQLQETISPPVVRVVQKPFRVDELIRATQNALAETAQVAG